MSGGLVIVGAGQAGLQVAVSAREAGFDGPVTLLGEEADAPYQRPPLSKGYLLGKVGRDALFLRAEDFYRSHHIDLALGEQAVALDREARVITTASGRRLGYDRLALTTGTRVRPLPVPGSELDGVVYLRSLTDAEALRERLDATDDAVVIGGGFIGLEIAAALRGLGKSVTVIEALPRLMARAVGEPVSRFFAEQHAAQGVSLRLDTGVAAIEGGDGRVRAVVTADGDRHPADLVVVSIGVLPNSELAAETGLPCPNGIGVDRFARTPDPAVVSAGDCTLHPSPFAETPIRLESVQNAADQARTAGASVAGQEVPYEAVPWFWSGQFDLKLQMVGLSAGHDHAVLRGDPAAKRFSALYFRGSRLIAIDSVNSPSDHITGRRLLAAGIGPTPEQAGDPDFSLKDLLKAHRRG